MEPTLYEMRPVPGFDGCFADTEGRIISRRRKNTIVRRSHVSNNGYFRMPFLFDGRRNNHYTHRLVAAAFLGPRPSGLQVNHIDGNKLNNRPGNLEYVSSAANIKHAFDNGLMHTAKGERAGHAKLTTGQVEELRKLGPFFLQRELAVVFGISRRSVGDILKGRTYRE